MVSYWISTVQRFPILFSVLLRSDLLCKSVSNCFHSLTTLFTYRALFAVKFVAEMEEGDPERGGEGGGNRIQGSNRMDAPNESLGGLLSSRGGVQICKGFGLRERVFKILLGHFDQFNSRSYNSPLPKFAQGVTCFIFCLVVSTQPK